MPPKAKKRTIESPLKKKTSGVKEFLMDEYYKYYEDFAKKFSKVAILMQCGKFYEIYAPVDFSRGNIRDLSIILNCNIARKDTPTPHQFSGFPLVSLDKNVTRLVEEDYTVVILEQTKIKDTSGKKLTRLITNIVSRGTTLSNDRRLRSNILSMFIKEYSKGSYSVGLAVIDRTVSESLVVYEAHSTEDDKNLALDTVIRFVTQFDPVECIITTEHNGSTDILKHLALDCPIYYKDVQSIEISYEKHSKAINFAVGSLLTFLDEHKMLMDEVDVQYYKSASYVDLSNTAAKQLDLPLFLSRIELNKTATAMGNRLYHWRLYNPIMDVQELQRRYDSIEKMTDEKCKIIQQHFKEIPDLEKMYTRMSLGKLSWIHMIMVHNSTKKLLETAIDIGEGDSVQFLRDMIRYMEDNLDFVENSPVRNNECDILFKSGKVPELDNYVKDLSKQIIIINDHVETFQTEFPEVTVKMEDGGFITTEKRAKTLKEKYRWEMSKYASNYLSYTPKLRDALCKATELEEDYMDTAPEEFSNFQIRFYLEHKENTRSAVKFASECDLNQANYRLAKRFALVRPTLTTEKKIRAKRLRHVLVEVIDETRRFVPNDCDMVEKESVGKLIFGVNSSGKTTFMKSLGMAVIMAQAGMFVPADSFEFAPFNRIMTRIAGGDNIQRSQSSFLVELEELTSIAFRADKNTLVLGDEICRGTEVDSANEIVYAMLTSLAEKDVFFLVATHLHELCNAFEENIEICHMKVLFDESGEPIYDRQILPGSGPKKYGAAIAKRYFPEKVNKLINRYAEKRIQQQSGPEKNDAVSIEKKSTATQTVSETQAVKRNGIKTSHFNKKTVVKECLSCGWFPTEEMHRDLEVHHFDFQCTANEKDVIDFFHKNAAHNLMVLCYKCHKLVHSKKLSIKRISRLDKDEFKFTRIDGIDV